MNRFVRHVVGHGGDLARVLESQGKDSGTRTIFYQKEEMAGMCELTREGVAFPKGRQDQEVT